MTFCKSRIPAASLCSTLLCALAYANCPLDTVIVKGRVEHSPLNARVRVQLFYLHDVVGESGEIILDGSEFALPVDFLTQSRRPVLLGGVLEKCNRKPETIVVTLLGGDPRQEYDRVTLKLRADFKQTDPGAYALKSEIVLKGPG